MFDCITIIFESISRSGLPNNSKFSEGQMFNSWNIFRKRIFRWRVWVCFNDYFQFFMCFVRKQINISVTLVSESYVWLYYETKVYMLFINKICLNQRPSKIIPYGSVVSEIIGSESVCVRVERHVYQQTVVSEI
jgi:hypothetical protein